jgi:hypothetical protein
VLAGLAPAGVRRIDAPCGRPDIAQFAASQADESPVSLSVLSRIGGPDRERRTPRMQPHVIHILVMLLNWLA